jgi:NadR type nicotinamide-nucleotide adenylyltransferase
MKTGLVLGKFAPLHKGHESMIRLACEETDRVLVLVYDSPEATDIPLSVRARWIRTLFPQAEVLEGWDGPSDIGDTPEIKRKQEAYVSNMLRGERVTHFYSSEFYGEHMSLALGAVDRRVDPKREKVPVSATMIRQSPYANRKFVDPVVYEDLIAKAAFLGAPSTGKSTLVAALGEAYRTAFMPEFGRAYWEAHQVDRRLTPEQLVELAEGHLERERRLVYEADRYLFVDTNAITTYMFSMDYHGTAHPRLLELAREAQSRYDLVFVCGDDIPYDDTWDRSGEMARGVFQKKILADLQERKLPYFLLEGTLEERMNKVKSVLAKFRKYRSLGEQLMNEHRGDII